MGNPKAPRPRDETTFPAEYISRLPPGLDPIFKRYTQGTFFDAHMEMSPLSAYDKPSDSFLVMDVNPNQAGWVWMPAALLFRAMRTRDVGENRGYLLVSEGTKF